MINLCFLIFMVSGVFVDALYRVQKVNTKSSQSIDSSFSNQRNPTVHTSKNIKEQEITKSSCFTGCPGCSVTAGSTGKVMSAPITLYHIYIGRQTTDYSSNNKFRTVLDSLAKGLQNTPSSPYTNILSGYTDSYGNKPSKNFVFGGSYVYTSTSTTLSETIVAKAIGAAINSNTGITMSTKAIYSILFRGDFSYCDPSGSCWGVDWCGYHSNIVPTGQTKSVVFAAVGDSTYGNVTGCTGVLPPAGYLYDFNGRFIGLNAPLTACIDSVSYASCTYGQSTTCTYCEFTPPNGDVPSDGAVTVYMHEVIEAITDGLNGFRVRDSGSQCYGYEIGDLCSDEF